MTRRERSDENEGKQSEALIHDFEQRHPKNLYKSGFQRYRLPACFRFHFSLLSSNPSTL
jgi:hypothetical protein